MAKKVVMRKEKRDCGVNDSTLCLQRRDLGLIPDSSIETMYKVYGDGSDHRCCAICGFCITCGDCEGFGCGREL